MRGKVLDYIHKNYNKKITLDDLCNIGTINKSYLIMTQQRGVVFAAPPSIFGGIING